MGRNMSLEEMRSLLPTLTPSVPDELSQRIMDELNIEAAKQDAQEDLTKHLPQRKWRRKNRLVPMVAGIMILFLLVLPSITVVEAIQGNTMAQTLLAWLRGTPAASWVTKVDMPVTSHGITLTITDILYDQNQIQVGYTLVPGREQHTGVNLEDTKISLNGAELNATLDGSETKTNYGFDGVFSIIPHNSLPESGSLKMVFSKVDGVSGRWAFNIPVTSIKMDQNMKVTYPMHQFIFKNQTVLIREILVAPSTTEIEYEVIGEKGSIIPVFFRIKDDKGIMMDGVSGGPAGRPLHVNGKEIEQFRQIYNTSDIHTKYLELDPFIIGQNPDKTVTIRIQLESQAEQTP